MSSLSRLSEQHGGVTTETVLVVPLLLVLLGFVVMAGRIGEVRATVVHAAQQAARAASLQADPGLAHAAAERTARANLNDATCRAVDVSVDASRFARGGQVGVSVACTVDLSAVSFAGFPGRRTVGSTAVEVVDLYRGGN